MILDILSWTFLVAGGGFAVVGGIGLLRMPDFYTRVHAAGITDTGGAGFILIGLMLQSGNAEVAIKLVMILVFLLLTSPMSGHALAKAAYVRGLEVWKRGDDR